MKDRPITYSKTIPIVTGLIFIACLLRGLTVNLENVIDTTVYVTSITVTGSIFASAIFNYSKKASMENAYKMKTVFYKNAINERLHFNEEMMKLKKQYEMTDDDVMSIEENGDVDEMMADAFDSAKNLVEQSTDSVEEVEETHQFRF